MPHQPPEIIDYRSAKVAPAAASASALAFFFAAFVVIGIVVQTVAVYWLGQWNSYLDRNGTVFCGTAMCLFAGVVAAVIFTPVALALRWARQSRLEPRSPLALIVTGCVYALATFLPVVIDIHFSGLPDNENGDNVGSGRGLMIGWICFFAGALLAPFGLLRWSRRALKKLP